MKERPILFSAPMVRAILEGLKTQTRRIVKPQPVGKDLRAALDGKWLEKPFAGLALPMIEDLPIECPYGQPGDRLWVRESGWERPERTAKMMREGADTWPRFAYAADGWNDQDRADFKAWGFKPRPSIHMPRWASRILLEITGVRVERLQDISDDDCLAEGIAQVVRERLPGLQQCGEYDAIDVDPAVEYQALWETINGPGSWADNPWAWVIEFRRLAP